MLFRATIYGLRPNFQNIETAKKKKPYHVIIPTPRSGNRTIRHGLPRPAALRSIVPLITLNNSQRSILGNTLIFLTGDLIAFQKAARWIVLAQGALVDRAKDAVDLFIDALKTVSMRLVDGQSVKAAASAPRPRVIQNIDYELARVLPLELVFGSRME